MGSKEFSKLLEAIKSCQGKILRYQQDVFFINLSGDDCRELKTALEQNHILEQLIVEQMFADPRGFAILAHGFAKVRMLSLTFRHHIEWYANEGVGCDPPITAEIVEAIIVRYPTLRAIDLKCATVVDQEMLVFRQWLFSEGKYIAIACAGDKDNAEASAIYRKLVSAAAAAELQKSWRAGATLLEITIKNMSLGQTEFNILFKDTTLFTKVKKISMSGCHMRLVVFQKLVVKLLPVCPELAELTIDNCSLTDEMGGFLLDYLLAHQENCPSKLNLSRNALTAVIAPKVMELIRIPNKIVNIRLEQKEGAPQELLSIENAVSLKLELRQQPSVFSLGTSNSPRDDYQHGMSQCRVRVDHTMIEILFQDITIFAKIRRINLSNCDIDPEIFKIFIPKLLSICPELSELAIINCGLNDEMASFLLDYLLAHPENCLSSINLSRNALTAAIGPKVMELIRIPNKIVEVRLEQKEGAPQELLVIQDAVSQAVRLKKELRQQSLMFRFRHDEYRMHISPLLLELLFQNMTIFGQVRRVHIEDCYITPDNFKTLITKLLPACPDLSELTVDGCGLTDEMGGFLIDHLLANQANCPAKLSLPNNALTNGVIVKINELLRIPNKIVAINLDENKVDAISGLSLLGAGLKLNKTLVSFRCIIRGISSQDIKNFMDIVDPNRALMETQLAAPLIGVGSSYADRQREIDYKKQLWPITKFINRNSKNTGLLFSYITTENIQDMNALFEVGVSMYTYDSVNNSLLHVAVQQGKTKVVQYLLSRNFNRKLTNSAGQIALEMATATTDPNIIALLKSDQVPVAPPIVAAAAGSAATPDKKRKGRSGQTNAKPVQAGPMDVFCRPGKGTVNGSGADGVASSSKTLSPPPAKAPKVDGVASDVARTLLPVAASPLLVVAQPPPVLQVINQPVFVEHPNLPYFMALNGNKDFFANLPQNFDVNKQYQNGCTLLHVAALHGHHEIIDLLLTRYDDKESVNSVNKVDDAGRTPLFYACFFADDDRHPTYEVAKTLVAHSADVNMQDKYGMTPLYLLAGGFDAYMNCEVKSTNLKHLARFLISRGANVNVTIHDLELNVANFSLLHKAVFKGNYHLVSAILAAKTCNLTLQDVYKNTAFHVAVFQRRVDIFARMLKEPDANSVCALIDAEGKNVGAMLAELKQIPNPDAELLQLVNLYDNFMQQQHANKMSGIRWVNPFSLFYGSRRPEKQYGFNLDDLHSSLAQSIEQQRSTFGGGNKVAVALSFVISTQPHTAENYSTNRRVLITIKFDTDSYKHVTDAWQTIERTGYRNRSPDMRDRLLFRLQSLPPDFEQSDDLNSTTALSPTSVRALYERSATIRPAFEELFHHSEQALLDFLEEDRTMIEIIGKLKSDPQFTRGCKIYTVVLNLYSPFYVCKNCEAALIGEQNSQRSVFLKKLRDALQGEGCVIAHNDHLHMLTCVSSKIPIQKSGMTKKRLEDHNSSWVDLCIDPSRLILQRDLESTTPKTTVFVSRK